MFQPSTVGHFGRQNRFKHGPFIVVRTSHPGNGDFLQLPSLAAGRNLRQYLYSAGVRRALADHQVPAWVSRYVPGGRSHAAQLIEMDDGRQMICTTRKRVESQRDGRLEQLHGHLWRVERSWDHVDTEATLNRALEALSQAVRGTFTDRFIRETALTTAALQRSGSCTVGELATFLEVNSPVAEGVLDTIVSRLMLAGRLGADLRNAGWCSETRLHWNRPGSGYVPPLPSAVNEEEAA